MKGVAKEKQSEEGIKICVETIQRLKQVSGVRGIHIMAIEWEEKVREIAEDVGVNANSLRSWVKRAKDPSVASAPANGPAPASDESASALSVCCKL